MSRNRKSSVHRLNERLRRRTHQHDHYSGRDGDDRPIESFSSTSTRERNNDATSTERYSPK